MRNVENKIIAAGLILITALCTTIFFMTLSLKNRKCPCEAKPTYSNVTPFDKSLHENAQQADSINKHYDPDDVGGAVRDLHERYRHNPK